MIPCVAKFRVNLTLIANTNNKPHSLDHSPIPSPRAPITSYHPTAGAAAPAPPPLGLGTSRLERARHFSRQVRAFPATGLGLFPGRARAQHQSLPLLLELKPALWASPPTAAAYLQKNEPAGWLKATATVVEAFAIWLGNAPFAQPQSMRAAAATTQEMPWTSTLRPPPPQSTEIPEPQQGFQ